MRMPLFCIVVIAVFGGSALRADEFEPWWGQTTSSVRVRQNGAVMDTLAKGAMVYVIGEPRPGFLEIRSVFEPVIAPPFEVSAAYVSRRDLPAEAPRQLGTKYFFAANHLVYDVLPGSDAAHIVTVGQDGRVTTLRTDELAGGMLPVPWDFANNAPALVGTGNPIGRYFLSASLLLGRGWGWWLVCLLFVAVAVLADIANGKIDKIGVVALYVPGLLLGYGFARFAAQFIERYTVVRGWIAPYVTAAGILPLPKVPWIKPWQLAPFPWVFYLFLIAWIPCFVLLHVAFIRSLPNAFKGIHYLLVRHPLEKELDGRPLDAGAVLAAVEVPKTAPLAFVSENLTRRLNALRRKVDAETAVLGSAIERERERAAHADRKKP